MSEDHLDRLDEAARWFAARQRGLMTVDKRAAYQAWANDPVNSSTMAILERTWARLETVKHRFHGTIQDTAPAPWSHLARPALVAAMCAVSLGIGVLSYSDDTGFWTTLNWTDR